MVPEEKEPFYFHWKPFFFESDTLHDISPCIGSGRFGRRQGVIPLWRGKINPWFKCDVRISRLDRFFFLMNLEITGFDFFF